jgi:hypothetical protein
MSLIKKVDVQAHFAARRAMRANRMRPLGHRATAGIEQAPAAKSVADGVNGGAAEKSSSAGSVTGIPKD